MSNHILAIGIDQYSKCTKLNNAVRDIENILDVLTSKYDFDKSNITTLLNEDATLEKITNEFEDLLSSQDESQNLIILFSGHGDYDELLEMGYLIPQEATPYSKSTYLPYSTLFSYIKALKSHHVLLISDSCFSGSVFAPFRKIETSKDKLDKIPSKWAITSGRLEVVSDGNPGENSPFADALLKILNDDSHESISISEMSNRIVSDVAEKVDQIPRGEPLQAYGHKGGEFIFRKTQKKKTTKNKSKDGDGDGQLGSLIDAFYVLEERLEEAENDNKPGTIRRLKQEKDSLNRILNKELLKELEYQNTELKINSLLDDVFPKEYITTYEDLLKVRDEKNEVIKKQQYEKAAEIRDREIKLGRQLTDIIDTYKLLKILKFLPDTLYEDYSICQIVIRTQVKTNSNTRSNIEQVFGRLVFYDYSFSRGHLSQFIYQDSRDKLINALNNEIKSL